MRSVEAAGANYWDSRPDPSDEEITDVCRAWVRYQRKPSPKDEHDPDWWAAEAVMDATFEPPEGLEWRLVLCLCSLVDPADERTISMIGAGPLEELIRAEGDRAMDLIEPVANHDPVLLEALAGVWGFDLPVRPRIDRYLVAQGQPRL